MIAVLASDARVLAVTDLVRADGPTALFTWLDEPPFVPIPALKLTVGATTTRIQTTMAGCKDVEFKVQPHVPRSSSGSTGTRSCQPCSPSTLCRGADL